MTQSNSSPTLKFLSALLDGVQKDVARSRASRGESPRHVGTESVASFATPPAPVRPMPPAIRQHFRNPGNSGR